MRSSLCVSSFQLTPPIQRATRDVFHRCVSWHISTHAPYTEGDFVSKLQKVVSMVHFNSRPLYRGRLVTVKRKSYISLFQLTPPIQRATGIFINADCGGKISTHAPYTEGDMERCSLINGESYFNSRPLYRGRL